MPSISVIVPVYQAEKFLHRCLDSVARQTFSDWELILYNAIVPHLWRKVNGFSGGLWSWSGFGGRFAFLLQEKFLRKSVFSPL